MLELEVYAAGLRDLNKILELDRELEAIQGLRYKVDSNHNIVYLEMDEATITLREIRGIFRKLGLDPRGVSGLLRFPSLNIVTPEQCAADLQRPTSDLCLPTSDHEPVLRKFARA